VAEWLRAPSHCACQARRDQGFSRGAGSPHARAATTLVWVLLVMAKTLHALGVCVCLCAPQPIAPWPLPGALAAGTRVCKARGVVRTMYDIRNALGIHSRWRNHVSAAVIVRYLDQRYTWWRAAAHCARQERRDQGLSLAAGVWHAQPHGAHVWVLQAMAETCAGQWVLFESGRRPSVCCCTPPACFQRAPLGA